MLDRSMGRCALSMQAEEVLERLPYLLTIRHGFERVIQPIPLQGVVALAKRLLHVTPETGPERRPITLEVESVVWRVTIPSHTTVQRVRGRATRRNAVPNHPIPSGGLAGDCRQERLHAGPLVSRCPQPAAQLRHVRIGPDKL